MEKVGLLTEFCDCAAEFGMKFKKLKNGSDETVLFCKYMKLPGAEEGLNILVRVNAFGTGLMISLPNIKPLEMHKREGIYKFLSEMNSMNTLATMYINDFDYLAASYQWIYPCHLDVEKVKSFLHDFLSEVYAVLPLLQVHNYIKMDEA